MEKKLLFEDASHAQVELAEDIRERILNEFHDMSIDDFSNVNINHFSKYDIRKYINNKDDVYFFIQYKNVKTFTMIINTILKMNRKQI